MVPRSSVWLSPNNCWASCLIIYSFYRYQYHLNIVISCGLSAAATSAVALVTVASGQVRALVVLFVPTAATTATGRAGLVLMTVAALVAGPVLNVALNIKEIARSMTCNADVAYNQTLILMQVPDTV